MNNSSTLIKGLILPLIIKMSKGNLNTLSDDFWNQFANDFIHYEIDAQPIYSTLYKLELQNPEDVFDKLPQAYSSFINELAEEYVLGNENEIIIKLLESNNEFFLKEVTFLKTMKVVITKLERQDIKKNLPEAYERLVFELDEETLRQVAKKKSREDLRAKFEHWDEEFVKEESNLKLKEYSIVRESNSSFDNEESVYPSNPKRKVISLSWIKYAAAACIVLTAGIMNFKFDSDNNFVQPGDTNVVTAPVKKDTTSKGTIIPEIPSEALAEVVSEAKTALVIESSLGFASKEKKIKIIENNQRARMQSIVIAIDKYRQFLEKELTENKVGFGPVIKEIESKIKALQNELALLKERDNHYIFDGKSLILYSSNFAKENVIVLYEDKYYLKRDADFYSLTIAKQQQAYKKVTDASLVEVLYNLYFEILP
jgi:hypothetical protein